MNVDELANFTKGRLGSRALEKRSTQGAKLLAMVFFALCSAFAIAQDDDEESSLTDFSNSFDFQTLGGMAQRLEAHGDDLMGDKIDKLTGGISFEHMDVSLPGNSGLEVALRRKLVQGWARYSPRQQAFGAWALDIPIAYFGYGYKDSNRDDPEFNDGCLTKAPRGGSLTTSAVGHSGTSVKFHSDTHRTGTTLHVPGKGLSGFQSTLRTTNNPGLLDPASAWVSGGQGTDYLGRCAEIAIAPDGTKYKFGRHTLRRAAPSSVFVPHLDARGPTYEGVVYSTSMRRVDLNRRYAVYLVTEVQDVHGNWVRYKYNVDGELERIYSNDQREIDIQYSNATLYDSRQITSISAHGRTWSYEYTSGRLSKVTLPDNRYWEFALKEMGNEVYEHWNCAPSNRGFSMKHPDGATGTFKIRETRHIKLSIEPEPFDGEGYSFIAQEIGPPADTNQTLCRGGPIIPSHQAPEGLPFFRAMSVVEKTIDSPNIPAATWKFEYRGYSDGGPDDDWRNIETTWTKITEPDGTQRRYQYHTNGTDLGLLERIDVSSPSGAAERYAYEYYISAFLHPDCGFRSGEYGDPLGTCYSYNKRPETKVKHVRDGVTYTTESNHNKIYGLFIDYGYPNKITRYSSLKPSEKRITDIKYWHNKPANIIARKQRISHNDKEFTFNNYNSLGQVTSVNATGELWESYTYHTDGNLHTITDPLGYSATLSNYHRGQAQTIRLRDNSTIRRTVNDNGWVTSETNARGYTTGYDYTAAGWMKKIDRPNNWADTNISYSNLGANNFFRRITRGTKETVEWYDSMLRVIKTRDKANSGGGVTSYVKTSFDPMGRTIFTSLPSTSSNPTQGTNTTYDGLGRVTKTRENFSPFVTITTEYLTGNKIRVTDPLGNRTLSTRTGYSSPNDGQVTLIEQPESVDTSMTYNIYGDILSATQGDGVNSSTQRWSYYNDSLQLCRHYTPETGSTLYSYDARRQVQIYSEGNTGTTGCAALPANNRVAHSYDARQRLKKIAYSNYAPAVHITYDLNGNVKSNGRGSASWAYNYDSLDQLEDEVLTIDGRTYWLSYEYDAMGTMVSRTLPSGRKISFTPNGLGQVASVKSDGVNYASGINYHANGSIAGMNYGNGQVFSQTLNSRLQPENLVSAKGGTTALDLDYDYDERGDIVDIDDAVNASRNRTMTYDDLGRLETARGAWGAGSFNYDALGNLKSKQLGSRKVTVNYDAAKNRATRSTDTTGSTRSINYDSRGNVTKLGALNFVYDMANQPTQLSGSSTGSYVYDGNFKRVKAVVDGKTIYNVFDASGSLVHVDEVSGSNITVCLTSCSTLAVPGSTDYIRANGMTIVRLKNGNPTYLHTDLLGSPVAATNAQGNIAWQEHYTPYGEKWLKAAANDDQMSFTGHIADSATGLTYMQARYYDPVIGRFLSNDPVGFVGHLERGNSPAFGLNRYAYANSNPYKYSDPDGEFSFITGAIGAAVGGVVGGISAAVTSGGSLDAIAGGIAGGAVTGGIIGGTGNVVLGSAAGSAVSSAITQKLETGSIEGSKLLTDTAIGTAAGALVPGVKVNGITSGNGSFKHVANTQTTRIANGTTQSITLTTAGKAVAAEAVESSGQTAAEAVGQAATGIEFREATCLPANPFNC